jgi:hypothetical protein
MFAEFFALLYSNLDLHCVLALKWIDAQRKQIRMETHPRADLAWRTKSGATC